MTDQISNLFTTLKQVGEFSNVALVPLAEFKKELADLTVDRFTIEDLRKLGSKDAKLQHQARELECHLSMTKKTWLCFHR